MTNDKKAAHFTRQMKTKGWDDENRASLFHARIRISYFVFRTLIFHPPFGWPLHHPAFSSSAVPTSVPQPRIYRIDRYALCATSYIVYVYPCLRVGILYRTHRYLHVHVTLQSASRIATGTLFILIPCSRYEYVRVSRNYDLYLLIYNYEYLPITAVLSFARANFSTFCPRTCICVTTKR